MSAATYRVGVDIGGTFTDIVLLGSDGTIHTKKISSSVENYARAIVEGLDEVFRETGLTGGAIEELRHGTTVASNAILEHKGAKVGLITTKGFRDILEIRTLRMPKLYDITWTKPLPLVERYLRQVVDERLDARGQVERPLDPADGERAVDDLLAEGVEAIAICLINSFANPAHELILRDIVRRKAPKLPLSVSCEVLPEIKEYERTSTTVVNAYVMPIVASYLRALRKGLDEAGIPARLLLMQSNGGLTTDSAAAERPMNIIESGPAGGVVGAQALARAKQLPKIITFDMGGTTAKASMVEDGEVARAAEYSVGAGIMIGSRLLTGAGYTLKVPAIDLAEVGAGGGSLVWIDGGGALQIGPESAGASPGPVCYDKGGEAPTVTDANVLLGYINPHHLVGGAVTLNAEKARRAFAEKVASPLGMTIERAAHGAHQIAASNMIRAIKAVSTERGRDPREFALFAFGGNGPLFACGIASALGPHPHRRAALGRTLLVLRPALRRRRASLRPHLPPAAAPGGSGGDRPCLGRAGGSGDGAARQRGLPRRQTPGFAAPPRSTIAARATSSRSRCRRDASTARWSPGSRTPSAASTSAPTVTAPAPRSRWSWSRSRWWARASARAPASRRKCARAAPSPRRRRRARPISAPSTAGSRRPCSAAAISARRRRVLSSSRNTTPPAW